MRAPILFFINYVFNAESAPGLWCNSHFMPCLILKLRVAFVPAEIVFHFGKCALRIFTRCAHRLLLLRVGVVPCIEISSSGVFLVYLSGFPTLLENCLLSKQASCRSDAGAPNKMILSIGTFLKTKKLLRLEKIRLFFDMLNTHARCRFR